MLTHTSPNLQFSTFAGHTALLSRPLLFQAANTSGVKPQILWFCQPMVGVPRKVPWDRECSCCHTPLSSHSPWDPPGSLKDVF